ncbi:hypothetical protein AALD74_02400 [Lachnospiraceae bacterium 48-21]
MDNAAIAREDFALMKRWLENKNAKKSFADYFHQCGYQTIAIHGAGDIGRLLYEEVKESDIQVKYFVDRNGEGIHEIDGIPVITISQIGEMEDVDIVVITFINSYDTMSRRLARYVPEIRTLSIKEAIYEM